MPPRRSSHEKIRAALLKRALAYPDAHEDHPWGETVVKVKGKVFIFLGTSDGALSLSVKLPQSSGVALMFPFASPTGYGLGRSGWVSAKFAPGEAVPEPVLLDWLDESFRAVAPKGVLKKLPPPTP